jgi:lipoprotein-anchoring transpeptidase ErfK/SrfK
MHWATFWAISSQTHLVALSSAQRNGYVDKLPTFGSYEKLTIASGKRGPNPTQTIQVNKRFRRRGRRLGLHT